MLGRTRIAPLKAINRNFNTLAVLPGWLGARQSHQTAGVDWLAAATWYPRQTLVSPRVSPLTTSRSNLSHARTSNLSSFSVIYKPPQNSCHHRSAISISRTNIQSSASDCDFASLLETLTPPPSPCLKKHPTTLTSPAARLLRDSKALEALLGHKRCKL